MKKKLNCVLLIDDDEATNFIHDMVVRQSGVTDNIVAVESGQAALDFLNSNDGSGANKPDLIFLDINMPGMNGWEFLEKYKLLDDDKRGGIVMVMLTTSLNPDDAMKSKKFNSIKDFLNKPLSTEMIDKVVEKHFPDNN